MLVQIPFDGFYESAIASLVDDALEYFIEDHEDEKLTTDDLDWTIDYEAIARACHDHYIKCLKAHLKDEYGVDIPITSKFMSLDMPKEYNFISDTIVSDIPLDIMQKLYELCDKTKLDKIVKDRYTTRSGFISFYSNDYKTWGELESWQCHQANCILDVLMPDYLDDFREYIYDDRVSEIICNCVDIKIAE